LVGDGGEAVIGGYGNVGRVGQREIGKSLADAAQIPVSVFNRRERSGSINAAGQLVKPVSPVVLRAIGVAG
jgi:hypothetical protein